MVKFGIYVILLEIKVVGVLIFNWEVMERLKLMVVLDQFNVLKVVLIFYKVFCDRFFDFV